MGGRFVITVLFAWLMVFVMAAQISNAVFTLVNKHGQITNVFYQGDEVRVRVTPLGTFQGVIEIRMIDPGGKSTMPIPPVNLCGGTQTEQFITVMQVTDQSPPGKYALYIAVKDCRTGGHLGEQPLEFSVGGGGSYVPPPPPPPDNTPLIIGAAVVVAVGLVAVALLVRRKQQPQYVSVPSPSVAPGAPRQPTAIRGAGTAVLPQAGVAAGGTMVGAPLAYLELPNGMQIPITSTSREIGRQDLAQYLPQDVAQYVSSRHFRLMYSGGQWYVEDLGSTNGTLVDGQQIRGKGPVPVKNGSVISPAGVIKLTFRTGTVVKQ